MGCSNKAKAYGFRSPSIEAKHTRTLSDSVELWARINEFGATPPVDIFPFLKLVPERFLGNWRTRAKVVHDALHDLYYNLMSSVIRRRESIGSVGSIMDRLLEGQEKTGLTSHQIAFICGVTIKGGSDTSASVLSSTIQALLTWPEVQKKAQAEMDLVVGEDRLPTWEDYEKLPYVAAMVKESHRWRPVAPLGVPHALSEGKVAGPDG
jgi:cytochrome P450 family 619